MHTFTNTSGFSFADTAGMVFYPNTQAVPFVRCCQALLCGLPIQANQNISYRIGWFLYAFQKNMNLLSRGDHTSARLGVVAPLPDEARAGLAVLSSLSDRVAGFQKTLAFLSRGDHTATVQNNAIPLPDEARGVSALVLAVSDQVAGRQKNTNLLSRGDHTNAVQAGIVPLPDEGRGNQAALLSLSDQAAAMQAAVNLLSRGDRTQSNQATIAPLPDSTMNRHQLINSLSESVAKLQKQINTLSADPISAYHQLLSAIAENADVRACQQIGVALADAAGQYFSTAAEIYLDGRPLSARWVTAEILCDENNVHNSLTLTSADPELFDWANPEILYGQPRIEAHIGTRLIYFIIDTRPGERSGFTINCLSVSAKEDGPYAAEIDFSLSGAATASSIADGLTNYCPVDWQAPDWVVPAGFSFSGYPLDGIQALAAEIGAVVRCQDDGSLLVRKRRPVRPIHMDGATAAVDYDQSLLISLSQSEESASGYNAVEVAGLSSDIFIPQIMLEDVPDGPYVGQTVYLRVYWAGRPVSVIETYATAGLLTLIGGGGFYDQIEEELVEFKSGTASLPLPIYGLVSWEWIGDSGGQITYQQYGNDLIIADNAFRVARVKYQTQHQRYSVSGHNVEQLIAVLFLNPADEVRARVRTSDEPVYAPEISAPLLTTDYAAVERGTAEIDDIKYRKSIISVEAPYDDAAVDGVLAYINDDQIGYPGNHHITSSKIVIDGPKITNVLGMEKCLISFNS